MIDDGLSSLAGAGLDTAVVSGLAASHNIQAMVKILIERIKHVYSFRQSSVVYDKARITHLFGCIQASY